MLPSRSSDRLDAFAHNSRFITTGSGSSQWIHGSVVDCVNFLVNTVVLRARHSSEGRVDKMYYVAGKRCRRKIDAQLPSASSQRRAGLITGRMRAAALTQRRSRGCEYRREKLRRQAAEKRAVDLEWLSAQTRRLATVLARRDLHELLPDGACCLGVSFPLHSQISLASLAQVIIRRHSWTG